MSLVMKIVDAIVGLALFVYAFFAVISGVAKEPIVIALVVFLFIGGIRLIWNAKK